VGFFVNSQGHDVGGWFVLLADNVGTVLWKEVWSDKFIWSFSWSLESSP
jgi:hypothetical protein